MVTSKIVALAEGRTSKAETDEEREQLIRDESEFALPTKYVWLTIKDGMVMASAGIDRSNADGVTILLPEDSYKAAEDIRTQLKDFFGIKELGILITDSRTTPLKAGTTGVATGFAGFEGIKDYRGTNDLFGRPFKVSNINIADSLATAAVLTMGEGTEQQPLATITGAPIEFSETVDRERQTIALEDDMYRPLFDSLPKEEE